MSNSAMINSVRDFKKARNAQTDNVVDIRSQPSLAEMHFARADEAHIEVTIETPSETLTCEEVIMNTNTTANTAGATPNNLKVELSALAKTVEAALQEGTAQAQPAVEEQIETVSVRDVVKARKGIRTKQIIENVGMAVVTAATISATGRKFGRNKKAADITAGVFGGLIAYNAISKVSQGKAEIIAKYGDDEEVKAASTFNLFDEVIPSLVGSVVCGALVGRFLVRKAKEVVNDAAE